MGNDLKFKEKIAKFRFENKISAEYPNQRHLLSSRVHQEHDGTCVSLYYHDDVHIGSWCEGKGWLFSDECVQKGRESMKQVKERLIELRKRDGVQ